VRVTNTTTYTDTIDGWGKVTTPVGSYKCLRQKRKENSSTKIEFDLTGFGIWTTYTTINSNTVKYFYLTKETHGTVINFNYDSLNNPISASWSLTPPAAPVAHFGHTAGAGGAIALHDSTDGYPDTYSWNFGDGGPTSSAQSPNHTYAVNGTYYVCLTVTNAGGSNTWCDSVRVTNATGSLNPPLAVNDTATLRQPASVTIHATTNDINYVPADTLCVAAVWGAPAGWATIQGCGNILYHPLDSNHSGLDTFYYRVCDNGTQLCDTGLVIVNVLPLKPRAAFTYQVLNCNGDIFRNASQHDVTTTWEIKTLYVANVFDTVISNVDTFHFNAGGSIRFNYNFPIQVCLTVSNGHGDVAQKCDTIYQACTGIESIEAAKVSIYPNPANDKVMIDLSKADENTIKDIQAVELYSILGEKLKAVSLNGSSIVIAVSDLTAGTYLVGLRGAGQNKMIVGKIMIAR
jgi:PKD repeat protein